MYFLFQLSQEHRDAGSKRQMTTIDGLQPSPPWTQLRSGTGRTPKERRTRSRQQGNPKQLTRTRQEENIVQMSLSKLLQNKRKKRSHTFTQARQPPKTNFTPKILPPKYTQIYKNIPTFTPTHKKQSHTVRQTNFHQAISSIGQSQERQFPQLQRTQQENNKSSLPSNTGGHHISQPERTFLYL